MRGGRGWEVEGGSTRAEEEVAAVGRRECGENEHSSTVGSKRIEADRLVPSLL
jgi:hypothetical protein